MFAFIEGKVADKSGGAIVLMTGGVGYQLTCSLNTIQAAPAVGQTMRCLTYFSVREDAVELFGFATREEKRLFELLLGVGGVGPKAALSLLSSLPPDQLTLAVMTGNEKALTVAPGVGKKMAQRVLLELKDKLGVEDAPSFGGPSNIPAPDSGVALAMAALAELGYTQGEINAALKNLPPEITRTEDIVRHALRAMAM